MIPYIQIPPFEFLGLKFHVFGLLVALGFILASRAATVYAKRNRLPYEFIPDATILCLVFGFLGAHLFHVLAYEPEALLQRPMRLLEVWSGLSSYGGFLGAALALFVYFRRKGMSFLTHSDTAMMSFVVGQFLGRVGCFTVHDHPGKRTSFFLAVDFPGGARHDLGLYEAIFMLFLIGLFLALWRAGWNKTRGLIFAVCGSLYALVRFLLEFLRADDRFHVERRYLGLTPAQYVSLVLVVVLVALAVRLWKKREAYA